ncbi:hypothetical protein FB192DRAFT_1387669 [Mucor lusitanicus]|uniref:Secreted protein n=1 Tax=Mucor circinelloides f. lusitanicus TaxID=29924 RepID=A0A8H4BCQ9_MUCCL|nr:hypothetical protein FB192DRAFT_1387669 [Mucor lusitanicus]
MVKFLSLLAIACLTTCVFATEKSVTINGTPQTNVVANTCYHIKKAPLYEIANNSGGVLHLYTVPGCHGPSTPMAPSQAKN